ncbi:MAG: type II CAAX endopeptidase family protein [Vallitaleaceae bacterium]|jgi:membrane protease YdiL (CAAX protease family)|nr:type II CAAX endopeptidase family protein [Vallitaleaceae bacterium]
MNKTRALFESLLFVFIALLIQRMSYYSYSFYVFEKVKSGEIIVSIAGSTIQEQAIKYINETAIFYIIIGWLIAIALVVFTIKVSKQPLLDQLGHRPRFVNIFLAIIIGIGTVFLTYAIVHLSAEFFNVSYDSDTIIYYDSIWITIVALGLIIPFIEEFFFRGLILNNLSNLNSFLLIILIQSLFFSISHFNLYQAIYLIPLGFVAGYSVLKTRSFWIAVIIHLVFNGINLYMTLFNQYEYQFGQLLILFVLGMVLIVFGIDKLQGKKTRRKDVRRLPGVKSDSTNL